MPYARNDDTELYYEVHGPDDAPALVFAHGRGGNAASWWQQVAAFRNRYRVVVFDHRAFGRSTCPPGAFHVRHFDADLASILDHARIGRAALVCQSMGGNTGMRMAINRPDRVAALVLACTPAGVITDEVRRRREERAANLKEERARFGILALAQDYPERQPAMTALYEAIRAFNTGEGPDAQAKMTGPDSEIDLIGLVGLSVPTLMITGEHDALYPPDVLHQVAAAIPGCGVVDMKGVGHSAYFEDAPEFNMVVEEFLAQHWPGLE